MLTVQPMLKYLVIWIKLVKDSISIFLLACSENYYLKFL